MKKNRTFTFLALALVLCAPSFSLAKERQPIASYGYGEGYYYGQGYYQGTYKISITGSVSVSGNVSVSGALGKGSGSFVIDHPLDPVHKLLFHSFVESPEVKNVYDGIAVLDEDGEARVELPAYFEALNTDFRYQLKGLSGPMPNLFIKEEVRNNAFLIGGGSAEGTLSWQVTGVRKDPYIIANPIIPEVLKSTSTLVNRREYLHPDLYPDDTSFAKRLWLLIQGLAR